MDLRSDNQIGTVAGAGMQTAGAIWNTLGSAAKRIRDDAKRKQAQGISDGGNYWTMRPYLKSLINIPDYILQQTANQGISEYAIICLPAQGTGSTNSIIIDKLKMLTNQPVDPGAAPAVQALRGAIVTMASLGTVGTGGIIAAGEKKLAPNTAVQNIQKYLPYILGALAVGLIIFFISRKK